MKLPSVKVECARASADKSQYGLNCAYVNVGDRTITATDGHILVVAPVEVSKHGKTGGIQLTDKYWTAVR